MTLEEIRQSKKDMLSPCDVAEVLHCDPHGLRVMSKDHPEMIRFPFIRVGNRMKIPRLGFLLFMGVQNE